MTETKPLFQMLASLVQAIRNCETSGNDSWKIIHANRLRFLVKEWMPAGGGFDAGTEIDLDACKPDRLVFTTSFHHMNDVGMYDGWTDHTVTVSPTFDGISIKVSGRDRRDIKSYIADTFHEALTGRFDQKYQYEQADTKL